MSSSVDEGQTVLQAASSGPVTIVATRVRDSKLRKPMDRIDVNQARVMGFVTAAGEG